MQPKFILIMGVSGSGKSTVGIALAHRLGQEFYDADDFHSPENISKMAVGIPLNDFDRSPWLSSLHLLISSCLKESRPAILACSALKEGYRQQLLEDCNNVQIIYLKGSFDLIKSRLALRAGHYMNLTLLQSQFDALEEPRDAIVMDISLSVKEIVKQIVEKVME